MQVISSHHHLNRSDLIQRAFGQQGQGRGYKIHPETIGNLVPQLPTGLLGVINTSLAQNALINDLRFIMNQLRIIATQPATNQNGQHGQIVALVQATIQRLQPEFPELNTRQVKGEIIKLRYARPIQVFAARELLRVVSGIEQQYVRTQVSAQLYLRQLQQQGQGRGYKIRRGVKIHPEPQPPAPIDRLNHRIRGIILNKLRGQEPEEAQILDSALDLINVDHRPLDEITSHILHYRINAHRARLLDFLNRKIENEQSKDVKRKYEMFRNDFNSERPVFRQMIYQNIRREMEQILPEIRLTRGLIKRSLQEGGGIDKYVRRIVDRYAPRAILQQDAERLQTINSL